MSQADGNATDHCSSGRVIVGSYNLPTNHSGRPVLHPQDAQEHGTDKQKVKCVTTPGDQKCTPNNPDKPEHCHCRGFIKDGDKWKEPKKDDDGWYDNSSDNPVRCWCVRKT